MRQIKVFTDNIAIIGGGNIGQSIARGLLSTKKIKPSQITITRKHINLLDNFKKRGCIVTDNNHEAIKDSTFIITAVRPEQTAPLLTSIKKILNPHQHILISVATGITIKRIQEIIGTDIPIVRAMPNTAISVGESMTSLSSDNNENEHIFRVKELFDIVGKTLIIDEIDILHATILCACGIAYFLRTIRAASQGGIEIGFHPAEAIEMAAQTAKGASSLLLTSKKHPEEEIDKVTTPRGITIAGLNQMEHEGLSSAIIKGIITSARMAERIRKKWSLQSDSSNK